MSVATKTLAGFLATVNPILKSYDMEIDMSLTRERCLPYPPTPTSYEDEFPSVDLYDLQPRARDNVFMHYFVTLKDMAVTVEGYCIARFEVEELVADYVSVDSLHPPFERTAAGNEKYRKIQGFIKGLIPIIVKSMNEYLKS